MWIKNFCGALVNTDLLSCIQIGNRQGKFCVEGFDSTNESVTVWGYGTQEETQKRIDSIAAALDSGERLLDMSR